MKHHKSDCYKLQLHSMNNLDYNQNQNRRDIYHHHCIEKHHLMKHHKIDFYKLQLYNMIDLKHIQNQSQRNIRHYYYIEEYLLMKYHRGNFRQDWLISCELFWWLFLGVQDKFLVLRGNGLSVVGSLFGVLVSSLDWSTVGLSVGFCVGFVDGWLDGLTAGLQLDITHQSCYI